MSKKSIFCAISICSLLVLSGCSSHEESNAVDGGGAVDSHIDTSVEVSEIPVVEVQNALDMTVASEPDADKKKSELVPEKKPIPIVMDVKDLPFRLCAVMSGDARGSQAGLVAWQGGAYAIVSAGKSFLGYKIEKIDYVEESITLSLNGRLMLVKLAGDDSIKERPLIVDKKSPNQSGTNIILTVKAPLFDPLPEELTAGIDPNDYETWPAEYHGPAIERLLIVTHGDGTYELGHSDSIGIRIPSARSQLNFEPTEKEILRGIDPNDTDTWPQDYRGPGIERAFGNE